MTEQSAWPQSQLLGRELDPAELDDSGLYMTIHVGGALDGDVTLEADLDTRLVTVTARWVTGNIPSQESTSGMPMDDAEALAAQWADELAAGHEPQPAEKRP
ncbi:MAG TPA: hypothetical protein VGG41_21165 [Solirubrobacteraceae bacterium]|jgi:hypothetical protein